MDVYHCYMLGMKGTTKYEDEKLADTTDKIIEYCLDNPSVKALDAFARHI